MPKVFWLLLIACSSGTIGTAAEWGDLRVRFVYDGPSPQPRRLDVRKDVEYCGKTELVDESLLVNDADGGVANVVIYLANEDGKPISVHPSYEMRDAGNSKLLIENCRFQPHVCFLRTSQTLVIENKDPVGHNPRVDARDNVSFSDLIPSGPSVTRRLSKPERHPVAVTCSIHPWLSAWLVVRDNPYGAVSNAQGKAFIRQLPVGRWRFRIWHERWGWISNMTGDDRTEPWEKGYVEIAIANGENDLGEIRLSPPQFKR